MLNVVLVEPQIPPNTGNVIRLCANTGARLHLVQPMGFAVDHAKMRRAGLDYHELANMTVHQDWQTFTDYAAHKGGANARLLAITTRGRGNALDIAFTETDWLVFGSETRGLSTAILDSFDAQNRLRIPMQPGNRSLNLSNAVAVVVYQAWRQLGFNGAG